MTIIPYMTPERDESINALIRKVAESERLPLFDVYTRYRAELCTGRTCSTTAATRSRKSRRSTASGSSRSSGGARSW